MNSYLFLPLAFLKFWYIDAPSEIIGFFRSLNSSFFQLFSLPLFLRTYFKPLKNEYREGLVGFSIAMGIVVKTFFIIVDLLILLVLLMVEFAILFFFLAFPILTVMLLFQ